MVFVTKERNASINITKSNKEKYHGAYKQLPRVDLDASYSSSSSFNSTNASFSRSITIDSGCQADFSSIEPPKFSSTIYQPKPESLIKSRWFVIYPLLIIFAGYTVFVANRPLEKIETIQIPDNPVEVELVSPEFELEIKNLLNQLREQIIENSKLSEETSKSTLLAQSESTQILQGIEEKSQNQIEILNKRIVDLENEFFTAKTAQIEINAKTAEDMVLMKTEFSFMDQLKILEEKISSNNDHIENYNEKLDNLINSHLEKFGILQQNMDQKIDDIECTKSETFDGADITNLVQNMQNFVQEKFEKYESDKTGMADYALESAGAEIISSLTTSGLSSGSAMVKIWNFPIYYQTMSPRIAIQPDVYPGNCFAFKGSNGNLAIRLSHKIQVQNITIEHIPKSLSPQGNVDSAPKNFQVYQLTDLNTVTNNSIGSFTFDVHASPIQIFQTKKVVANSIMLNFSSNWGHFSHTCVYRVRVHGVLV